MLRHPTNRSRVWLVAAAVFLLAAAWLFSASLFGGKVLAPNDIAFFTPPFSAERPATLTRPENPDLTDPFEILDPQMLAARHDIRSGHLPIWDPSIGAGRPLIASQQAIPFFPLSWLAFFTPFWKSLAWIAALRLVLAALGMAFLCRALGLGGRASVLGGFAFGFGTGALVWAEHPLSDVVAAMPWMFAFAERIWQRAKLIDGLGLALALGLGLLGGHPETFFVAAVGLASFVIFRAVVEARAGGARALPRRGAVLTLAGILGALLGAVTVVPLLELVAHAYHPSRNLLGPDPAGRMLAGSLFPEMFGSPNKVDFIAHKTTIGDLFAGRAVYLGALPLLLAVGGLAVRRSAIQLFFAALGLLSALAVVGFPVLGSLVRHLPGFSTVYAHWFIWLAILSGSVLSAFGLEALINADRAELKRMSAVMAAAALGALVWGLTRIHGGLPWSAALGQLPVMSDQPSSPQAAALGSVIRFAILAFALGTIIVIRGRARAPQVVTVCALLAIGITAVDLLSLDHGFHPQISPSLADPKAPPSLSALQAAAGSQRTIGEGPVLHPDLAERYHVNDARAAALPQPKRVTALFSALGGVVDPSVGVTLYNPLAGHARELLDLFGVRHVLAISSRGLGADAALRPVAIQDGEAVLLNPTALPRAWVAYDWRTVHGSADALRATVASTAAHSEQSPVIEGAGHSPGLPPSPPVAGTVTHDGTTEVTIRAQARRPGYLILDDIYYPGWTAEVNGHQAQIRPANAAFRAVAIPAGSDRVTFRYQPESVSAGLWLTVAGLAAVVLLALAFTLSRPRRWVRARPGHTPTSTEKR